MAVPVTSSTDSGNFLALDVGERRVGVATAHAVARIVRPLATVLHDEQVFTAIADIVRTELIGTLVVGLPRNLNGEDTPQTILVREFAAQLSDVIGVPVQFQDEALTSVKAEQELKARGKQYERGDIDALAAAYILEDYLAEQKDVR